MPARCAPRYLWLCAASAPIRVAVCRERFATLFRSIEAAVDT